MAEIQTLPTKKQKGVKQLIKKSTRVDLTPMVDLGFLLITFFVFTTTMAKPRVMKLDMPYDQTKAIDPICESCVLTVLLDKDDKIRYYEGDIENDPPIGITTFSSDGIRKILLQKKAVVKKVRGNEDQFILIIKAADSSSFKNFVDMVDEVAISNIKKYYVAELNQHDKKILEDRK